ncbi:MAG: hypothetical protein H8E25_06770 [Planctomycetes bacterium]|nr:hypothetical protein [Planctomycetota bacterium]
MQKPNLAVTIYFPSWLAAIVSLSLVSFVGYELTRPANGGRPSVAHDASSPISDGHPQWSILQKALTLLEQAANTCASDDTVAGQDSTFQQDVIAKLKSMADDDRIDLGRNEGRAQGDKADTHVLATTVTVGHFWAQTNGLNRIPIYQGKGPGGSLIAPGINLMPDAFPAGPGSPTDVALLASILFHEGVHAEKMHGNKADASDADEREAYIQENAMICCLISYLSSTQPDGFEEMTDALCVRNWVISVLYICKYNGDASSFDNCECPPPAWFEWLCGTFTPNSAPSPVLPRGPLPAAEMNIMSVSSRNSLGVFTATLFPANKSLLVSHYGKSSGSYNFDLSTQTEGVFQPLCMIGDDSGIYVCGRIEGGTEAVIYHCTFSWAGTEPTIQSSIILTGGGIGDITAAANITTLNGKLAVFDYTNAAIKYVDIATGVVTTIVSADGIHSDLLQARGMIADFVQADSALGTSAGIWFTLQAEQSINLLGANIFWLNVIDYSFDGTVDDYFTE